MPSSAFVSYAATTFAAVALSTSTRPVSGFTVEIVKESKEKSSVTVKENDHVIVKAQAKIDPMTENEKEGYILGQPEEGHPMPMTVNGEPHPDGAHPALPYGWWKGMIGAKLGEKRVITVPESEGFTGKDAEMLPEGHRGTILTVEFWSINDHNIEGFSGRAGGARAGRRRR